MIICAQILKSFVFLLVDLALLNFHTGMSASICFLFASIVWPKW